MNSFGKAAILFIVLIGLGIIYRKYDDKILLQETKDEYEAIQKYLLNDTNLGSKKPILWIHVPYEYNSRKWINFYSRSSFDLNQPYMYLCVRSIIRQCKDDFNIVIIDDKSFEKLIPSWKVDMNKISNPIVSNFRKLGKMKLLNMYGGLFCPISFVCMKSIKPMYDNIEKHNKPIVGETVNRNITSVVSEFSPNIDFIGSKKNDPTIREMINFTERLISNDFGSTSEFIGDISRWCKSKIEKNKILLVDGKYIGTKDMNDNQVIIDRLISKEYINFYEQKYGILIPNEELLKRIDYKWFAYLNEKMVLESNTIIGNYMLLANSPDPTGDKNIVKPIPNINTKGWVEFWKTPLYNNLYGMKPNFLGNNVLYSK